MSNLREIMAEEATRRGGMTFARFMELALYCPNFGYYQRPDMIPGRTGDFYTSVSVGSLFGEMLAFQFAEWLAALPAGPRQVVEAGAHDGRLALDILRWLRAKRPELAGTVEYWIIEPSETRRNSQEKTLGEIAGMVRWFESWGAITNLVGTRCPSSLTKPATTESPDATSAHAAEARPNVSSPSPSRMREGEGRGEVAPFSLAKSATSAYAAQSLPPFPPLLGERAGVRASVGVNGIIFSNELLDAMPAHRLGWNAAKHEWFEWGVGVQGGDFVWTHLPLPEDLNAAAGLAKLPPELLAVLPDGFTTEVCPAAVTWWRQAARALQAGKLLTIDYGLTADQFFTPERKDGTLRAYTRHHASPNLLVQPGEQDLTAQVNFTPIQEAGETEGLQTEAFLSQAQFLVRILEKILPAQETFGEWTDKHNRQFQTLTHPEHLGRPFRVLLQGW